MHPVLKQLRRPFVRQTAVLQVGAYAALGISFLVSLALAHLLQPDVFGADDFCHMCRVCTEACPPDAIFEEKQTVRGERKWYVNFDKCIPYFAESRGCGICIAVCPWSRPGVGTNLLAKMAKRREANDGEPV